MSRNLGSPVSGFRYPVSGICLTTLCLLAALASGCSKPTSAGSTATQTLRVSQRNEPANLDPAHATLPDEFAILRAVSEGLLIPGDNSGPPQPGVATRVEVSPDGLVYTYHLRTDARWTDRQPVTSHAFVASYRRLLTPATAAPKASVFFPVKNARAFVSGKITDFSLVGFKATGDHTLVITLEQPTPRFAYYVSSGPWLPVPIRVIEKHGRDWLRPENFVGNGPFTLAEWRPDQRIIVKQNPHWHGTASVRLTDIHFLRFDSGDSEERAYRAGQADATMAVPFSKIDTYAQERPTELHRSPLLETRYLSFNTRRRPLDDPRVRRALALALDRKQIVERVVRGGQIPAGTFLPPGLREGATPPEAVAHRHDPETARQLLAAAGITAANFPQLEMTAWSPSQTPVLEVVQQMWRRELGLDVAIAIREARVHWNALRAGDYDIAYVSAIPDVADTAQMLGDFVTGAPDNYPHWSDPAYDQSVARAMTLVDRQARADAFVLAEQQLLASAPLTPIYFNTKIWLMSPRVRGWQEDGLWTRCYQSIYLDEK